MPTELNAGRVLGRSLSLLFSNAGAFLLITVLLRLPMILLRLYLTPESASAALRGNALPFIFAVEMVLQPLVTASVTYGVLKQLKGEPTSFTGCIRAGLSRMAPVLGVALVSGLITLVGLLLLCAPGFLAATMFFVAAPAAVVERLDVGPALRRSLELTEGSRFAIFSLLLMLTLLMLGMAVLLMIAFFGPRALSDVDTGSRAHVVVELVISLLMQTVQAIAGAVAYRDLRAMRDRRPPSSSLF